ncbi:MAG: hypothetical protein ABSH00_20400 [Bryobacteraceae bacterium]|jgi:hypothetical protein
MIRRLFVAAALSICPVLAGPPLTTIQDVLYKADGARFNGTLTISWTSFQAVDNSSVVTQSTTVKVLNGNLHVELVPNTTSTPATVYTVTYNSDGFAQFQETWSVPSSLTPLHVRDVRTAPASSGGSDTTDAGATSIPESSVVGLVADLGARPLVAPGFAAGHVAMINSSGQVDSVVGNPADCVYVNGSSGPCGSGGSGSAYNFVDGDSPDGTIDGSNTVFTLNGVPNPTSSIALYRNGVLQKAGFDYTLSGSGAIQFASASTPQPTDVLLASYRTAASGSTSWPAPQVLCSGTGAAASLSSMTALAACSIPGGLLAPGDRLEIHADYAHVGSAGAAAISIQWGGTTALNVSAAAVETMLTGRLDGSILTTGAQVSSQSWGASTSFATGVLSAPDSYSAGLTLKFLGSVAAGADVIALQHYSVVRVP